MTQTMETVRVGGVPGGYPSEIDSTVKVRFVDDSEIINLSDLSTDFLKLIGGVSQFTFDNEKVEWPEHDIWGRRLSSQGGLAAAGTTSLTVTGQAGRYPVGTILIDITATNRDMARVTAHVDANTLTLERGYAGTTAGVWANTDTVMVAGFTMNEDDNWVYRPSYVLTLPYNLHQIQHTALKQTWHNAGVRKYGTGTGDADFAGQVAQTMAEQLVSVEQNLIVGQRYAGAGPATPSMSGGLEYYITSGNGAQETDLSDASVTRKDVEDIVQDLAHAVGRQNSANLIVCGYWFNRKMTQFFDAKERMPPNESIAGLSIERIRIPGLGVVQLLPHIAMPEDEAFFLKLENIKVGTFAGLGQPHVGEIIQTAGPFTGRYFYMNWTSEIKGVQGMGIIKKFNLTS